MKAGVIVKLREEIADAAGNVLSERLSSMGFHEVKACRVGKFIELEIEAGDREGIGQRIEKMCQMLLANESIEEYNIVDLG